MLCEALWATGWREERIVAIITGGRQQGCAMQAVELAACSNAGRCDIDNWEHVDHLADVTGRLLVADRALLASR